jgi:hypothetical protein
MPEMLEIITNLTEGMSGALTVTINEVFREGKIAGQLQIVVTFLNIPETGKVVGRRSRSKVYAYAMQCT